MIIHFIERPYFVENLREASVWSWERRRLMREKNLYFVIDIFPIKSQMEPFGVLTGFTVPGSRSYRTGWIAVLSGLDLVRNF